MVIDHDDLYTAHLGQFQGIVGRNAVVNRDDDARAFCYGAFDSGRLETVSVLVAVGQEAVAVGTHALEKIQQHGGAANPIDVVVAVHDDLLAVADSAF